MVSIFEHLTKAVKLKRAYAMVVDEKLLSSCAVDADSGADASCVQIGFNPGVPETILGQKGSILFAHKCRALLLLS